MTNTVRVLERVVKHAPVGLCVWDVAAATHLVDGLEIDIVVKNQPERRVRAYANRSGIYCAVDVPGLRRFEFNDADNADDAAAYAAALHHYRIEIQDPLHRLLPLAFDADLPARGLFDWLLPGVSPPAHFQLPTEQDSPPRFMQCRIPLFSSPERPVPGALAAMRAHVREFGTQRSASWCLVTASIDGNVRGIGLADREGRVALLFPYPDRARPASMSPPLAMNDFVWNVDLQAYYVPRAAGASPPDMPDLSDLVAQLAEPRLLLRSTASPSQALPPQPLEYRIPVTVRTEVPPPATPCFLFVSPT